MQSGPVNSQLNFRPRLPLGQGNLAYYKVARCRAFCATLNLSPAAAGEKDSSLVERIVQTVSTFKPRGNWQHVNFAGAPVVRDRQRELHSNPTVGSGVQLERHSWG